MVINKLRLLLRSDLEASSEQRRFGTGWISGVGALVFSVAALFLVICLRYPGYFTMPELRFMQGAQWFRYALHLLLIAAFLLSALSLALRAQLCRVLGSTSMCLTLLATLLGGSRVEQSGEITSGVFLGLDWFVLNVLFTGFLFIPLEQLFSHRAEQPLFRQEWREDLFYFLVSSLFVQILSFLSLTPVQLFVEHTSWPALRGAVASQPAALQFIEIMFLTDLVQYWVHRSFHRIPYLWRFHSVHHSAQVMDWMAGARMHVLEIIILRAATVVPMFALGYSTGVLHAYIFTVYLYSTFIHANVGWNLDRLGKIFVTPRFHHWHHGIEREAIDVNFAIHFPLLDKLFGTYYMPAGKWPAGYGIKGHPVPRSYINQFLYPFRKKM